MVIDPMVDNHCYSDEALSPTAPYTDNEADWDSQPLEKVWLRSNLF